MCRLFGLTSAPHRTRATFWPLDAPDSLSDQSHRDPDGTGLGYFDPDGSPQVRKAPIAAYKDRDFAQEARLFAHNGVVQGLDKLDAHLGNDRSPVRGDTDSERFFALIT